MLYNYTDATFNSSNYLVDLWGLKPVSMFCKHLTFVLPSWFSSTTHIVHYSQTSIYKHKPNLSVINISQIVLKSENRAQGGDMLIPEFNQTKS